MVLEGNEFPGSHLAILLVFSYKNGQQLSQKPFPSKAIKSLVVVCATLKETCPNVPHSRQTQSLFTG